MMYQINSDRILYTQMGDDGVIFDIKKNTYVTLNETYLRIFQLLQEKDTELEVINALVNEYDVDIHTCQQEVSRCISELKKQDYLV